MKDYNVKNQDIKMYNVIFATTDSDSFEEERLLLLEYMPNTDMFNYVLAEGYHCSCYGFDDCKFEAWELNNKELEKLLEQKSLNKCRIELKKFLEGK